MINKDLFYALAEKLKRIVTKQPKEPKPTKPRKEIR